MNNDWAIGELSESEFYEFLKRAIQECMEKYLPPEMIYNAVNKGAIPKEFIPQSKAFELLEISRQTFYLRKKSKRFGKMVIPFFLKFRGRNYINLLGLCILISLNDDLFHGNNYINILRGYDEKSDDYRYFLIMAKMVSPNLIVNGADIEFYMKMCEKRGEKILAP